MKKKTIYLHVGTTKTGTTTIQMFLKQNKDVLRRKGFAEYTPCRTEEENDPGRMRSLVAYMNLLCPHLLTSKRKTEWFGRFMKNLREDPVDNIILSEECLWGVIGSWRKRIAFKKFVHELQEFFEVRLIVYLRRQDNFVMSAYQQRLKGGGMNGMTCSQWLLRRDGDSRIDYKARLEWLFPLIGRQNITVRPFEVCQFLNGSLAADFLNCIGLKLDDDFTPPSQNRNPGVAPFLAEIIRCLSFYYHDKEYVRPFLWLKRTANECYFNQNKQHQFLSPQERCHLMQRQEESNQWIARELLGRDDGRLFYDPLPSVDEVWSDFKLNEHDVKEFFATVRYLSEIQRKTMCEQVLSAVHGQLSRRAKIWHGIIVFKQRVRLKLAVLLGLSLPCGLEK